MPEVVCPECETVRYLHPHAIGAPFSCGACGHVVEPEGYAPRLEQLVLGPSTSFAPGPASPPGIGAAPPVMIVECPQCKVRIKTPQSKAGATVPCPGCRQPFIVPVPVPARLVGPDAPPARAPLAILKEATRRIFCPGCGRSIDVPESELQGAIECAVCAAHFVPVAPAGPVEEVEPARRQRRRSPLVIGFICPYCGTDAPPTSKSEVTAAGWIVFIVLLLGLCTFPLCWLGFLIREDRRACSQCGIKIGG